MVFTSLSWRPPALGQPGRGQKARHQAARACCELGGKQSPGQERRNQGAEPRTPALPAQALAPDEAALLNFALFATRWHYIKRNGEDFSTFGMDLAAKTLICVGKAWIQAEQGCPCSSVSGLPVWPKAFLHHFNLL